MVGLNANSQGDVVQIIVMYFVYKLDQMEWSA